MAKRVIDPKVLIQFEDLYARRKSLDPTEKRRYSVLKPEIEKHAPKAYKRIVAGEKSDVVKIDGLTAEQCEELDDLNSRVQTLKGDELKRRTTLRDIQRHFRKVNMKKRREEALSEIIENPMLALAEVIEEICKMMGEGLEVPELEELDEIVAKVEAIKNSING